MYENLLVSPGGIQDAALNWIKRLGNIKVSGSKIESNTGREQFDRDSILIAKTAITEGGDPFWGAWDRKTSELTNLEDKAAFFAHFVRDAYGLDHDDCNCSVTKQSAGFDYWQEKTPDRAIDPGPEGWSKECPHCHAAVAEGQQTCAHCGASLVDHAEPWSDDPDYQGGFENYFSSVWKETASNPAQSARLMKEKHPEKYCANPKCLYRTDAEYCPKHQTTTSAWKESIDRGGIPGHVDFPTRAEAEADMRGDEDEGCPNCGSHTRPSIGYGVISCPDCGYEQPDRPRLAADKVSAVPCPRCGAAMRGEFDPHYVCPSCGYDTNSVGSGGERPLRLRANVQKNSEYKYVKKRGDKWVIIQKGTGKVLSEHDSEEKAKESFRAMMMNKSNLQKGSPYPKNDNAVNHSAPGHHLPEKVNEIYNAIMREHPEYGKEKAMRIAWERSGEKHEAATLDPRQQYHIERLQNGLLRVDDRSSGLTGLYDPSLFSRHSGDLNLRPQFLQQLWMEKQQSGLDGQVRDDIPGNTTFPAEWNSKWHVVAEDQMTDVAYNLGDGGPQQRNAIETWVNIAVEKFNNNPDLVNHPEMVSDMLRQMGCPDEIADRIVAMAANRPQEETVPDQPAASQQPAPSEQAEPQVTEQPQPQVMRGAKVRSGDTEGIFRGSYEDAWGQRIAEVKTASGIIQVNPDSLEVVSQEKISPVSHIDEFVGDMEPYSENRAAIKTRLANLKTLRSMIRRVITEVDPNEQIRLDQMDADAAVEILNLADRAEWLGDSQVPGSHFHYDGFDTEPNGPEQDTSDLEEMMQEHAPVVVGDLGIAATDPDAITYAASKYISPFVATLNKQQRAAMTQKFIDVALEYKL